VAPDRADWFRAVVQAAESAHLSIAVGA